MSNVTIVLTDSDFERFDRTVTYKLICPDQTMPGGVFVQGMTTDEFLAIYEMAKAAPHAVWGTEECCQEYAWLKRVLKAIGVK